MTEDTNAESAPGATHPSQRRVPFLELLEVRQREITPGRAVFELTIADKHLRTLGILHGGVSAALLDTALGMAAGSLAPDGYYVVTAQLNVNFIRPAWNGETLVATGEVQHNGQQTAVARGELRTVSDLLVATGSGTFMYLPHRGQPEETLPQLPD